MKQPGKKTNLQHQFNLFIYLGIFLWVVTIPFVYLEIKNMNHHIVNLELSGDIYDAILEMRRYEKNFLLYSNAADLDATVFYFGQARRLLEIRANEAGGRRLDSNFKRLEKGLKSYGEVIGFLQKLSPAVSATEGKRTNIRSAGKMVIEPAESLLKAERGKIKRVATRVLWWPPMFMGAMVLLLAAMAIRLIKNVIRPLGEIERATEKIAQGDFRPIPNTGEVRNQVDHLVTAFNRMARELEAREEQIIHSRKMSSLGTLVSGTAHELNNPINNIALTVDTLIGGKKITEERRTQLLNDILTQALRASGIVKNLLDFSRAQTSGYETLDLAKLLQETVKIAQNQMTLSHITFRDEISGQLPLMKGNRQGLQQVFLNMITNAVQAMPNGGCLTVSASLENDHKIHVKVQDTGCGICTENLPHIFDPFFTTKEVGKGTGLGLAVSYGIVRKHGGQITVASKEKEGTAFTVILPVQ